MESHEKRQNKRIPCEIESSFKNLADPAVTPLSQTTLNDISEGGVRFRSNHFVSVHHKLLFKINIPNHKTIEVLAQPSWIREIPSLNQYDIGAKFISLSDTDRDIIRKFMGGPSAQI